jgi:hypothetical protein
MRRLPLPEIEDQPWLPTVLRDAVTAFLRTITTWKRPFDAAGPVIASLLPLSPSSSRPHVVDLCSGGGGALVDLMRRPGLLPPDCSALLTDLYPNEPAYKFLEAQLPGRVKGVREPVDAAAVPRSLRGVRTLFNSLHHLPPSAVESCMRDAADAGEPFAAFEVVERHPLALLTMAGGMPFLPLLLVPFSRPLRLSTLFFTYVFPLVPLLAAFDGFMSCLRAYSMEELEEFCARGNKVEEERAAAAQGSGQKAAAYEWRVGASPRAYGGWAPFRLVWIEGRPVAGAAAAARPAAVEGVVVGKEERQRGGVAVRARAGNGGGGGR